MNNQNQGGTQEAPKTSSEGDSKPNQQQQGQGDNKQDNSTKPDQQQQK